MIFEKITVSAVSRIFAKTFLSLLIYGLSLSTFTACHTTPRINNHKEAGFDGNEQNSGIIGFTPQGGLEITESAKTRYMSFVEQYGARLIPSIKGEFGLTKLSNGNYELTAQGAEAWRWMIIIRERELTGDK